MKKSRKFTLVALTLAAIIALSGCNGSGSVTLPSIPSTPQVTDSTSVPAPIDTTTSITEETPTSTTTTRPQTTTTKKPQTTTTKKPQTTTTKKPQTTTTAKPQTTTATANPVPTIENIENRSIINYQRGKQNFKVTKNLVLYDFSDKKDVGVSRDGTIHPARMHYGITARLDGSKIIFATYNDYPDICKVSVKALDIISDTKISGIKVTDKTMALDVSGYDNGLYSIRATFSNDKKVALYFYVNGDEVFLCSIDAMTDIELQEFNKRRHTVSTLLKKKNLTPENSLDTSNLCYPWNDREGWNSDTDDWAKFSYKITKPEWSDARKLFAMHEWMCDNLAYDYYKYSVLKERRASYYGVYDGTYDTWESRIGVCFDFTNILATMCREQGIPCNTLDTYTHTWNVVYINGSWVEVDMTADIRNQVLGEDMTKWTCTTSEFCYKGYFDEFVNDKEPLVSNDWLWDYDILTNNRECINVTY